MKIAASYLITLCLLAVFAPSVSPYLPYDQDRAHALRPPFSFTSAHDKEVKFFPLGADSHRHLYGAASGKFFIFGTDTFGRDLFSRICYGARISLTISLLGTLLALAAGTAVGLVAATFGGWIDALCMELTNFVLSLPNLFVVLALRALFPWEITTFEIYIVIVCILALLGWADIARVVRAKLMQMKSQDYIQAAVATGIPPGRLLWRHLLPGLIPYWLVQGTALIPAFLMIEITLSFLGAGIREPDPSWGNILRQGLSLSVLGSSPWILTPGLFIVITVVSFNVLGERLGRRLEPAR